MLVQRQQTGAARANGGADAGGADAGLRPSAATGGTNAAEPVMQHTQSTTGFTANTEKTVHSAGSPPSMSQPSTSGREAHGGQLFSTEVSDHAYFPHCYSVSLNPWFFILKCGDARQSDRFALDWVTWKGRGLSRWQGDPCSLLEGSPTKCCHLKPQVPHVWWL